MTQILRELAQQVILEHNSHPKNFGLLPFATHSFITPNILCGDRWKIELRIEDKAVKGIAYTGSGCAISKAACSIMTTLIQGHTLDVALNRCESVRSHMASLRPQPLAPELEVIAVFAAFGVRGAGKVCALLPWTGLHSLLTSLPCSTETPT